MPPIWVQFYVTQMGGFIMICNCEKFSIDYRLQNSSYKVYKAIRTFIDLPDNCYKDVIILCIGTDRSTGDCLGPLVGEKLVQNPLMKHITIYGTLSNPIHAGNITDCINNINSSFLNPLIIAVDASLGKSENLGFINITNGPLFPGSAVNKTISPVGDISITGIVNMAGFMEFMVLQSTRLSIVMKIADVISLGLYMALKANLPSITDSSYNKLINHI